MNVSFTTDETVRRADELIDYMRGPRLWIPSVDYPDFDEWSERARIQFRREDERAVLAISDGNIVGAVVYQRHASDPSALEIKNLTVRPDQRGRHVASFLLRNAEIEGMHDYPGVFRCVLDAKARNFGMRAFLLRFGYVPWHVRDVYGLGCGVDIVFSRKLRPRLSMT